MLSLNYGIFVLALKESIIKNTSHFVHVIIEPPIWKCAKEISTPAVTAPLGAATRSGVNWKRILTSKYQPKSGRYCKRVRSKRLALLLQQVQIDKDPTVSVHIFFKLLKNYIMATRLEKLPPSSSGGNMLSTNKNCETSSNNPNKTTTQVDNRSVALAVHDLEKILFRVRHRMNRLRREQPQLDLQSMEKALDECWEAAEGLTSFWSWFSTKQAKILREKYLALITALGATAYLDIGVTEDESNRISAFVQDIVKYLVDFAERIQWLTTGTIAGGVAVAASIAIMEWLFGMGRFLVMRAPIMAVQWIAQWFVAMGLSAGGAYAIATAIFACALVGISWIAFKVILVPIGAYFFASIAER